MNKILIAITLVLSSISFTTTAHASDFFGGNNGEWKMGPNGPYWDESDWPEWTPMYWMEEFMDSWDDNDSWGGNSFGFGNNNGNYGYGAPYGGYGMSPYGYGQAPYGYGAPYGAYGAYGGGYAYPQAPVAPPAIVPAQ